MLTIDDELQYTIKGPSGEWLYRDWEPIYLEPDAVKYVKFSWTIPSDAPSGVYTLRAEFYNPDIDYLPLSTRFRVGSQ